jgi:hypothetical protein
MFVRHIVCDLGINDHHYKYWCSLWSIFDLFNNATNRMKLNQLKVRSNKKTNNCKRLTLLRLLRGIYVN